MLVLRNNKFQDINENEVGTVGIDLTDDLGQNVFVEVSELIQNEDTPLLLDMIFGCEFDVLVDKEGKLWLEDYQHANLGEIENECFESIIDIVYRMETYFEDYWGIE